MSELVPACVKTRASRECAELFSPFSSFDCDCQCGSFPIQRNRDKSSTRKFDVGVFTQAGSKPEKLNASICFPLCTGCTHITDSAPTSRHVRNVQPISDLQANSTASPSGRVPLVVAVSASAPAAVSSADVARTPRCVGPASVVIVVVVGPG